MRRPISYDAMDGSLQPIVAALAELGDDESSALITTANSGKVKKEKVETEEVKKVKRTKEELRRQDAKRSSAGAGKKGAS